MTCGSSEEGKSEKLQSENQWLKRTIEQYRREFDEKDILLRTFQDDFIKCASAWEQNLRLWQQNDTTQKDQDPYSPYPPCFEAHQVKPTQTSPLFVSPQGEKAGLDFVLEAECSERTFIRFQLDLCHNQLCHIHDLIHIRFLSETAIIG